MQRQAQRLQAFVGPGLRRLQVHTAPRCHGQRGGGQRLGEQVRIELLTGNPAGGPEVADSVLARAGQTLRDYRQACRRFGRRAGR